jgi:23S rRNA pseudouridine1911/1915/1917 synthase
MPVHSRSFLQKLIGAGQVQVNDRAAKPSQKVRAGDVVALIVPPPAPLALAPEAIGLDVLYEDDDLVVVNKPAGMVVHPGAGHQTHTLVHALLHHCRGQLAGIGGVERPGIVHRLDQGTSGCIVVAKTDLAHQSLAAQFKARQTTKGYRAVCRGVVEPARGRLETLIGRSARDRQKMSTRVERGRAAVTEYAVLRQTPDWALVEVRIQTGRTHQIRVHMAHLGHPILGDTVYGGAKSQIENRNSQIPVVRPLLHAYKLGFTHPRRGDRREFTAPLPGDMLPYT